MDTAFTTSLRYLRRILRELFERSGFTQDGDFDWVVAERRAQEQALSAATAIIDLTGAADEDGDGKGEDTVVPHTSLAPLLDPATCSAPSGTLLADNFSLALELLLTDHPLPFHMFPHLLFCRPPVRVWLGDGAE